MGTDQIRHCRIRTISNIRADHCLLYYIGNSGTADICLEIFGTGLKRRGRIF